MSIRFAFYGRSLLPPSEERNASVRWQRQTARALIAPYGGVVAAVIEGALNLPAGALARRRNGA